MPGMRAGLGDSCRASYCGHGPARGAGAMIAETSLARAAASDGATESVASGPGLLAAAAARRHLKEVAAKIGSFHERGRRKSSCIPTPRAPSTPSTHASLEARETSSSSSSPAEAPEAQRRPGTDTGTGSGSSCASAVWADAAGVFAPGSGAVVVPRAKLTGALRAMNFPRPPPGANTSARPAPRNVSKSCSREAARRVEHCFVNW
eukprot:TRINITY_DN5543_c3_g1_i1.p1 TRINITY_DN5543_c3_g1~~TRINITY_DN5543_c3_g1_i1.p1  ORF type:complete len:206 (+),score=34.55 TRINITY_DN5543_c3_g1_i1:277-894(+)